MTIAALILAAGRASRFGSLKQLAPINSKPMLQHCIDSANSALPGAVYTLLGYQSELIKPNITATKIIEHPQWARGIGSSISMGVNYLSSDFDAILIMLGDQPMIKSPYLTKLIDLFNRDQDQIQKHQIQKHQQSVCSRYQDNLGVPAIFSRRHFSDLMQLDGDQGAKQLLINLSPAPKTLTLKGLFKDVDYPQDLNSVLGDE